MHFNLFLKDIVLSKHTRKELMSRLASKYDDFSGLDPVTLSRWVKGITTPSIQRQILIAYCTNCTEEYIKYCTLRESSFSLKLSYQRLLEQFDNSYYSLAREVKTKETHYFSGKQDQAEPINGFYMDKMLFHKKVKDLSDVKIEMFYLSEGGCEKASSFLGMSSDTSSYLKRLKPRLEYSDLPVNDSIVIFLSFFQDKWDFKELSGLLLSHILLNHFNKEGIFLIVRGTGSVAWFDAIGAKRLCLLERSNRYGNVFIYYITTKKLFGNALVINLVKNAYDSYQKKRSVLYATSLHV